MLRSILIALVVMDIGAVRLATATTATFSLPAQITEGLFSTNNCTLAVDQAPATALTMTLSADPSDQLSIPSSVTIPAGQTKVIFTMNAVNDTKIDGNVTVTVTASGPGIPPATAQTIAIDNETRVLSLTLPATILEGGSASGTVTIPGTLTTPLTVNLSSSNSSQVAVPALVTIPAGSTSAAFSIDAPDNSIKDGSRVANISANADTFTTASKFITVRDNELAGYGFGVTDIVDLTGAFSVSAVDVEGNVIPGFSGDVHLEMVLPDGSAQLLTPSVVSLAGATGWTGTLTFPPTSVLPLRIRASDDKGNVSVSIPFDVLRMINLKTADLIWDPFRNRIYASVPADANSAYANQVVIIDPTTSQITGSLPIGQNPRKMALADGGEILYVALDSNGTVAKVDPTTMTVVSAFSMGSEPNYGAMYADDMCPVPGQPELLVLSRYSKTVAISITAAFDHGNILPNKVWSTNRVESSADPAIFFGYNNYTSGFELSRLQLDNNGLTSLAANGSLISGFSTDIKSSGNTVFSTTGWEVDGAQLVRSGSFSVVNPTAVCPDLALNRVYFLDARSSTNNSQEKLSAFDPSTFALARKLTLPFGIWPSSFVRWGVNGLAIGRSDTESILLVNSSRLVPNDPPADLAVTVQAPSDPVWVGQQFVYTVNLINRGPNSARDVLLTAVLSNSQAVVTQSSTKGTRTLSGLTISLNIDELAAGESATLTIGAYPFVAGKLSCKASATSSAADPDSTNNVDLKVINAGFQTTIDVINPVRVSANNIVYDSTRNLLWASVSNASNSSTDPTVFPDLSIVSINPMNGLVSEPILINANMVERSMAISPNGRYLYVGLYNSSELERIDLSTTPPTAVRIPLGTNPSGEPIYAQDIAVLDGDGTSFLMTGLVDHAAVVFDGSVPRPVRTAKYSVSRIERTAVPNQFVGYDNYTFPQATYALTKLSVTSSGVGIIQSDSNIFRVPYAELCGSGNLLLSSSGALVDTSAFALKSSLGVSGNPCLDAGNGRAYLLLSDNTLHIFDTSTGAAAKTLSFPSGSLCIRWGLDGLAVAGYDGRISIIRSSSTIPPGVDQNGDLISDAWEAAYFNTLNVDPLADADGDGIANLWEYVFVTSPVQSNGNPAHVSFVPGGEQGAIHMTFPRRAGLAPQSYSYEVSSDLQQWTLAQGVTETVVSTQTVGGVQVQTIDAAIPSLAGDHGFARLKWLGAGTP